MTVRAKVDPIQHHLLPPELVEELAGGIDRYNGRYHRTIRSAPVPRFAADPTPLRTLPERLVALALLPKREEKTVQKAGVEHAGRFYRHPRLNRYVGRKVEIGFSDRDPSFIHVFLHGEHLCKAVMNPSRAMAGGLKASRQRQIETFNRIELGAEKLRLESNGLSADDYDLETRRRERKNRRQNGTTRRADAGPTRPLSARRARHLEDETWKPG